MIAKYFMVYGFTLSLFASSRNQNVEASAAQKPTTRPPVTSAMAAILASNSRWMRPHWRSGGLSVQVCNSVPRAAVDAAQRVKLLEQEADEHHNRAQQHNKEGRFGGL